MSTLARFGDVYESRFISEYYGTSH